MAEIPIQMFPNCCANRVFPLLLNNDPQFIQGVTAASFSLPSELDHTLSDDCSSSGSQQTRKMFLKLWNVTWTLTAVLPVLSKVWLILHSLNIIITILIVSDTHQLCKNTTAYQTNAFTENVCVGVLRRTYLVTYTEKSLLSKYTLVSYQHDMYSIKERHIIKLFKTQVRQCRQQLINTCACGSGMAVTTMSSFLNRFISSSITEMCFQIT